MYVQLSEKEWARELLENWIDAAKEIAKKNGGDLSELRSVTKVAETKEIKYEQLNENDLVMARMRKDLPWIRCQICERRKAFACDFVYFFVIFCNLGKDNSLLLRVCGQNAML